MRSRCILIFIFCLFTVIFFLNISRLEEAGRRTDSWQSLQFFEANAGGPLLTFCPVAWLGKFTLDNFKKLAIISRKNGKSNKLKPKLPGKKDNHEKGVALNEVNYMLDQLESAHRTVYESEEKYRNLVELSFDGVAILQENWFQFTNQQLAEITGYTHQEIIGSNLFMFFPPSEHPRIQAYLSQQLSAVKPLSILETLVLNKDNKPVHVELRARPISYLTNYAILLTIHDITRHKDIEIKLEQQKRQLEVLFNNSTDAIIYYDHRGIILNVNPKFSELFGYLFDEVKNQDLLRFIVPQDRQAEAKQNIKKVIQGKSFVMESTRCTKDARLLEVLIKGIPVVISSKVTGGYAIYSDISERKGYQRRLERLSLHDSLTGVYNRTFFEEEMRRLEQSREYPISLVVIDIDNLKFFNDSLGHDVGDALLKSCADILTRSVRKSDTVARIGGDEFVVIAPKTDAPAAEEISRRIFSNLESSRENCRHYLLPLNISVGAATALTPGNSLIEAFKEADNKMYSEKMANKDFLLESLLNDLLAALTEKCLIKDGFQAFSFETIQDFARQISLSPEQLANIQLLSRVRDIGKAGIPLCALFNKEVELNGQDTRELRRHPEIGFRLAQNIPELHHIAPLILHHHEKWDGSGYPYGLTGKAIPLECRVFSILEAFDALAGSRPGPKKAEAAQKAAGELLRLAGSHFDPELAASFFETISQQGEQTSKS